MAPEGFGGNIRSVPLPEPLIRFHDRREAGRLLGGRLQHLRGDRPLVLALPRGGVAVGLEVAGALDAPFDVLVSLKLGAPGQPELAAGAIAPGVTLTLPRIVEALEISQRYLDVAADELRAEVEERMRTLRGDRPFPDVAARTVIVVDDGLATGATAAAAALSVRGMGARRIVVAAPVASMEAAASLDGADEVIADWVPERFENVSEWYEDFRPVTDAEVLELLRGAYSGSSPTRL